MKKIIPLLISICAWIANALAQVPTTDIYLMDMDVKNGNVSFGEAKKINDWKGYNNQPYFTPDGKTLYYVSYRNKQSDVYIYEITNNATIQLTNTPEDEYSPKLTPDYKYVSVVRVMKDSSQQLWKFPLNGGEPMHVLNSSDSIGYYIWRDNLIISANVPEPMNMQVKDAEGYEYNSTDKTYSLSQRQSFNLMIEKNVGRTLILNNNKSKDILFVRKSGKKGDSIYSICSLEINWNKHHKVPEYNTTEIVKTMANCEDFAIGPNQTIYMGSKSKLYRFKIGKDKNWQQIADFSEKPYKNFYRIVISQKGDRIALVAYEGKKP